jgi:preprotein translocase subunit SecE
MNQPMNRQTKRLMERQGADKPGEKRSRPQPGSSDPKRERVGVRAFFGEVKAELKKVAWPTRKEVFNSTVVVLIAVTFMTALIFGFDYASSKFVLFLFD